MKKTLFFAAAALIMLTAACSSKNEAKNAEGATDVEEQQTDPDKVNYVEQRKDSVADLNFMGYKVNEVVTEVDYNYYHAPEKDIELAGGNKITMKFFPFISEYSCPNRYSAYNADVNKKQIKDVLNTFIKKYGAFTYTFNTVGLWYKTPQLFGDKGYHPARDYAYKYAASAYESSGYDVDYEIKPKGIKYYNDYFNKLKSNKEALNAIMADADADLNECIATKTYGNTDDGQAYRRPFMSFVWEWKNQAIEVMVSYDVVFVTYVNGGYGFRKGHDRLLSEQEKKSDFKDADTVYSEKYVLKLVTSDHLFIENIPDKYRTKYMLVTDGSVEGNEFVVRFKSVVKDIYSRQSEEKIRVFIFLEDCGEIFPLYDVMYNGSDFDISNLDRSITEGRN